MLEIIYIFLPILFGYCVGRFKRRTVENENNGEAQVRHLLAEYCKNRDAHILNNVTLRLEDGSTTQIDHILITTKGIFVLETKHYSGWIFANPKSKFWTQTIFYLKNRFQNPIFQNYKHVKAIKKLFPFLESKFIYNVVVFSGEAEFKTSKPDNVFYLEELIPAIEQYADSALSLNRIQFCVGRLEYARLELTQETDLEHQAYLSKKFGQANIRF